LSQVIDDFLSYLFNLLLKWNISMIIRIHISVLSEGNQVR